MAAAGASGEESLSHPREAAAATASSPPAHGAAAARAVTDAAGAAPTLSSTRQPLRPCSVAQVKRGTFAGEQSVLQTSVSIKALYFQITSPPDLPTHRFLVEVPRAVRTLERCANVPWEQLALVGGLVAGPPVTERAGLPLGYRWHQALGMATRFSPLPYDSVFTRFAAHFPDAQMEDRYVPTRNRGSSPPDPPPGSLCTYVCALTTIRRARTHTHTHPLLITRETCPASARMHALDTLCSPAQAHSTNVSSHAACSADVRL